MYDGQAGLSVELRKRIDEFLERRFRAHRVSPDLLAITKAKIYAEAASQRSARHPDYPKPTAFPSVAQQIVWQIALGEIAEEFRREFPSRYVEPWEYLDTGRYPPPPTEELVWRIPRFITEAQGEFSYKFSQQPVAAPSGSRGELLRTFRGSAAPVRLTATGQKPIDDRIAAIVAELRTGNRLLDSATFPAPEATANAYLPTARFANSVGEALWVCLYMRPCSAVRDIANWALPYEHTPSAAEHASFLRHLYLTNPFGARSSASALVQTDGAGRIVAAFCGDDDIGYAMTQQPALRPSRLPYCLSEMIRPGSGALPDPRE